MSPLPPFAQRPIASWLLATFFRSAVLSALLVGMSGCLETGDLGTLPSDASSVLSPDVRLISPEGSGEESSVDAGQACSSNGDCPAPDTFCEKAVGQCDGVGVCTAKPASCPGSGVTGVCDCSHTTRDSECAAALAGENVATIDPCGAVPTFEAGGPIDAPTVQDAAPDDGPSDAGSIHVDP